MRNVTVDFGFDVDFAAELIEYAQRFNVVPIVLSMHGPGGGWPEVRFVGTLPNVENLAIAYFGADGQGETDLAWILSQIH
jgi:hypothetical protein